MPVIFKLPETPTSVSPTKPADQAQAITTSAYSGIGRESCPWLVVTMPAFKWRNLANIVTGRINGKSHHCNQCRSAVKRSCIGTHFDYCTSILPSGRRCGERFAVRSRGCATHPYSEGYNKKYEQYDCDPEAELSSINTKREEDGPELDQDQAEAEEEAEAEKEAEEPEIDRDPFTDWHARERTIRFMEPKKPKEKRKKQQPAELKSANETRRRLREQSSN